jgi:hypothetical protein
MVGGLKVSATALLELIEFVPVTTSPNCEKPNVILEEAIIVKTI